MQEQYHHFQTILTPYFHPLLQTYQSTIYTYCPSLRYATQFQIFLLLNATIISLVLLLRLLSCLNPFVIYRKLVHLSFKLPPVQKRIKMEIAKAKEQFIQHYPKKHRSQLKKIPYKYELTNVENQSQLESTKGFLSGSRYPEKKHSDFIISLAKQFSYSNPLHFDLHPHVKQMQVEVIKMCAKMLNFYSDKNEVVGGFFSGGTQSILMAILAYRQYALKKKNITKPNLVICTTGHAAALKAADFFGLEVKFVKSDSNQSMDVFSTWLNIDSNTVCVYTSYPNYPYGTVDPVEKIAKICRRKGVPVHIDMCLGGYLVPFLKNKYGDPYFVVPQGVTSISLDCHKYGLSAKGASVLLFSSQKYRKQQLFVTSEWPGGFYGTLGIAGSRSGATIASAWLSMMRLGVKGYTKNANAISNAVKTLAIELKQLGFKVHGNPQICCIGFNHPKYPISLLKQKLKQKGWDFPIIQKPISLHYSFTPINCIKIDQMIADFKQVVQQLMSSKFNLKQQQIKSSELQIYGICAKIPDTSTKNIIMKNVLDAFLEI